MGQLEQFAQQTFAGETERTTGGAVGWQDPHPRSDSKRVTGAKSPYLSWAGGIRGSRDIRHSNEVAPAGRRLAREQ
jgi:hypothetical protein